MKKQVASRIRAIFNAPNQAEAERLLKLFIGDYEKSAPRLAVGRRGITARVYGVFLCRRIEEKAANKQYCGAPQP